MQQIVEYSKEESRQVIPTLENSEGKPMEKHHSSLSFKIGDNIRTDASISQPASSSYSH